MPNRRDRDYDFDEDRPARRRTRDDYDDRDDYANGPGGGPRRGPARKRVNVWGIIALILGIKALVISLIPCVGMIGIPVAAIGLLLGIIGIFTAGQTTGRGLPIAGTCVSAAAMLVAIFWMALFTSMANSQRAAAEREAEIAQEEARKAEEKRQKEDKELREGKAVTVTAKQLYDDYRTNLLSADSKYKNKVLEITAPVDRVDKDRFGRAAVELKTDSDGVVRCDFPRDAIAQLEKLKTGQQVTIRGRCTGRGKKDEIKMEDCLLVTR